MKFQEKLQRFISTRRKDDESGFTLMEMLIVVAIIAVLIAIAIPIFTSQLENSREATDAANLRSAYATASAKVLSDGAKKGVSAGPVTMQQTAEGWNDGIKNQKIGNVTVNDIATSGDLYVNVGTDGTVSIGAANSEYTLVDPVNGTAATTTGNGN